MIFVLVHALAFFQNAKKEHAAGPKGFGKTEAAIRPLQDFMSKPVQHQGIPVESFVTYAKHVAYAKNYKRLKLYPGQIVMRNLCALRCTYIALRTLKHIDTDSRTTHQRLTKIESAIKMVRNLHSLWVRLMHKLAGLSTVYTKADYWFPEENQLASMKKSGIKSYNHEIDFEWTKKHKELLALPYFQKAAYKTVTFLRQRKLWVLLDKAMNRSIPAWLPNLQKRLLFDRATGALSSESPSGEIALPNGFTMPRVGFGTGGCRMDEYRPNDEVAKRLMRVAVDSGVRLFDTGEMYNNTHLLGQVLREAVGDGTLKHIGEVTIMTKVGRDEGDKCCDWGDNVTQQVEKQLRDLGVASLDLIAVHHRDAFTKGALRKIDADLASLAAGGGGGGKGKGKGKLVKGAAFSGVCNWVDDSLDEESGVVGWAAGRWEKLYPEGRMCSGVARQRAGIVARQVRRPFTTIGLCSFPNTTELPTLAYGAASSLSAAAVKPLLESFAAASGVEGGALGLVLAWYVHDSIVPLTCSTKERHIRRYLANARQSLDPALRHVLADFHVMYQWSIPCREKGEGEGQDSAKGDVFGIYSELMVPLCRKHAALIDGAAANRQTECDWYLDSL